MMENHASPLLNLPMEILHKICVHVVHQVESDLDIAAEVARCGVARDGVVPWQYSFPLVIHLYDFSLTSRVIRAIVEPLMYEKLLLNFSHRGHVHDGLKYLCDHPDVARRVKGVIATASTAVGLFGGGGAQFILDEARKKGFSLPDDKSLYTAEDYPAPFPRNVHQIAIDLALSYTPNVQSFVIWDYHIGFRLGDWLPPTLTFDSLHYLELRTDQSNGSMNMTHSLAVLSLLRHTPFIDTLRIQGYSSIDTEPRMWEFLPHLTVLDFDLGEYLGPRDPRFIGMHCKKLESFRYVSSQADLQLRMWPTRRRPRRGPTTPQDILEGLLPLKDTLRSLVLDLTDLTCVSGMADCLHLLSHFTGLQELQLYLDNMPTDDENLFIKHLPHNLERLGLVGLDSHSRAYYAARKLGEWVKAGGFQKLREIWWLSDQENLLSPKETIDAAFLNTNVACRASYAGLSRWH
ncbi:hypothetical protein QBC35DRAFT_536242 [Podospora australis]|uniref:Uncharacterized protein n=1 Tax=Podospora australis TaxID=1536484 RepID=A0AAN7AD38_9PEZI|nr:hypothetical protein QBC35DRAFT_536242 [Podospora australis]